MHLYHIIFFICILFSYILLGKFTYCIFLAVVLTCACIFLCLQRNLEGHVGDVYRCRFFPSGTVILTGGADTQLKIWSAENGQCAATLTGHKAGI